MILSCDVDFGRSWIIILNKIDAITDPWGIPMSIFLNEVSIFVITFRPDKNDLIYL